MDRRSWKGISISIFGRKRVHRLTWGSKTPSYCVVIDLLFAMCATALVTGYSYQILPRFEWPLWLGHIGWHYLSHHLAGWEWMHMACVSCLLAWFSTRVFCMCIRLPSFGVIIFWHQYGFSTCAWSSPCW